MVAQLYHQAQGANFGLLSWPAWAAVGLFSSPVKSDSYFILCMVNSFPTLSYDRSIALPKWTAVAEMWHMNFPSMECTAHNKQLFCLGYWQQISTHLSFNIICKTYIPDHVLSAKCQNRTYNQIMNTTMLLTQTIAFPLPNMRKTRQPNILRAAVIWKTAAQLFVVSKM